MPYTYPCKNGGIDLIWGERGDVAHEELLSDTIERKHMNDSNKK